MILCAAAVTLSKLPSVTHGWPLSAKALLVRDVHLGKAARDGRFHRCDNLRNMGFDEAPPPLTQYDNRNLAVPCSAASRYRSRRTGASQFAVFQLNILDMSGYPPRSRILDQYVPE
jgi:hypothetical protein